MNQLGLFDVCRNRHKGNRYSEAANASISGVKNPIRKKVLEYIRACGLDGATCDEVEKALKLSHQSASARCAELKAFKKIVDSGSTRVTSSGRRAAVLTVINGGLHDEGAN